MTFCENEMLALASNLKKKKMLVGKELMYSAIYCKIVSKQY